MSTALEMSDSSLQLMHAIASEVKRMVSPRLKYPRTRVLLQNLIHTIQLDFDEAVAERFGSTCPTDLAKKLIREELSRRSLQSFDTYVQKNFSLWQRLLHRSEHQSDRQALIDYVEALQSVLFKSN